MVSSEKWLRMSVILVPFVGVRGVRGHGVWVRFMSGGAEAIAGLHAPGAVRVVDRRSVISREVFKRGESKLNR